MLLHSFNRLIPFFYVHSSFLISIRHLTSRSSSHHLLLSLSFIRSCATLRGWCATLRGWCATLRVWCATLRVWCAILRVGGGISGVGRGFWRCCGAFMWCVRVLWVCGVFCWSGSVS